MLCSEASMVNTGWDGIQAVSLRCRAWTCPLCCESRRKQLVALALSGQPEGQGVYARKVMDTAAERDRLREVNTLLLKALGSLLPVAQAFEKQASKGTGGRRGGAVFTQARAAIAKAKEPKL